MGSYLGSNLVSDKVSRKKVPAQSFISISYLVYELRHAKVLMVFVHHLLSSENECAFVYIFFTTTVVNSLFEKPYSF